MNADLPPAPETESTPVDIHVDLAPGERVYISLESRPGEGVRLVERSHRLTEGRRAPLEWLLASGGLLERLRTLRPGLLFGAALLLYGLTRLVGLGRFPAWWSAAEVAGAVQAAGLINGGLASAQGELLPTFFQNAGLYTLGTSVYVQVLPVLLFGRSLWVLRGAAALLTVLAAAWMAQTLRAGLKTPAWWAAPLLLAAVPVWFLYSRTALEAPLFVTLYAGSLSAWLRSRQGSARALYAALVLAAAAFYTCLAGRAVVLVTGLVLLGLGCTRLRWVQLDWKNWVSFRRRTLSPSTLAGLGLLVLLVLPLVRFFILHPGQFTAPLLQSGSYWASGRPLFEQLGSFLLRWLEGFNPLYWFWPSAPAGGFTSAEAGGFASAPAGGFTPAEAGGFTPAEAGGFAPAAFPAWMLALILPGLWRVLRSLQEPFSRLTLAAFIAAPAGAALLEVNPEQGLAVCVPYILLAGAGLQTWLEWLESLLPRPGLGAGLLVGLCAAAGLLLNAALVQPQWALAGGSTGRSAPQAFTVIAQVLERDPQAQVILSPNWMDQPDALREYLLPGESRVAVGLPDTAAGSLDPQLGFKRFLLAPADLEAVRAAGLFSEPQPVWSANSLAGQPGPALVSLAYRADVEQVLAARRAERARLVEDQTVLDGQILPIRHSPIEGDVHNLFDGDPNSLVKTVATNPLVIELTFSDPRPVQGVQLRVGAEPVQVTVTAGIGPGQPTRVFSAQAGPVADYKTVTVSCDGDILARTLRVELFDVDAGESAIVHLWELSLLD